MKKLIITTAILLSACQAKTNDPQNFDDLLAITDRSETPICSLKLAGIRQNLPPSDLEIFTSEDLNLDRIAAKLTDDPAKQISVIFRRAALKRRLNVSHDDVSVAVKFYAEFNDEISNPSSLSDHHAKLHYWGNRLSEQSSFEPNSDEYNFRFCVLNEARAKVHSASRNFILSGLKDQSLSLSADVLENVNHESYYSETFVADVKSQLFTPRAVEKLSILERAKLRGDNNFLPGDPKTALEYWGKRDEEIGVMIDHIRSNSYETLADKLFDMHTIDQAIRSLFSDRAEVQNHFGDETEFQSFQDGIGDRMGKVDEFNTGQIKAMLTDRSWFRDHLDGDRASSLGWLIVQHADRDPEFQKSALKLMESEFETPGFSKSNYAYLYDRVQAAWSRQQDTNSNKQRYGTQGRCTGVGVWEPLPLEDPDNIDKIRAEVGLGSMAEYKSRFKDICHDDER